MTALPSNTLRSNQLQTDEDPGVQWLFNDLWGFYRLDTRVRMRFSAKREHGCYFQIFKLYTSVFFCKFSVDTMVFYYFMIFSVFHSFSLISALWESRLRRKPQQQVQLSWKRHQGPVRFCSSCCNSCVSWQRIAIMVSLTGSGKTWIQGLIPSTTVTLAMRVVMMEPNKTLS